MMKLFLFLLFFLIPYIGVCQDMKSAETKQFLNEFFTKNQFKNSKDLYYNEFLFEGAANLLIKAITTPESDSVYRTQSGEKIVFSLTSTEKNLIKNTLLKQAYTPWPDSLLTNARILRKSLIPSIRIEKDSSFNREDFRRYNSFFEGKYVLQFSAPVFLRNGSVCIFYYDDVSGGMVMIFRREENEWKMYLLRVLFYV